MGRVIAMAGKGGTGKTTIAALIIRFIKDKKLGSVLAIDADPNSNLAESLGVKSQSSIGEILDAIALYPDKIPAGMTKERFIQLQVQTAVQEENGFDLLNMGKPEGPGCYCYVNNVLRAVMENLIKDYDYIVIDNEAGLEHLSRRTTRLADLLVLVSDSSVVGLRSVKKIVELVRQLKFEVKKSFLLVNRFNKGTQKQEIKEIGLDYLGSLPFDQDIERLSLKGGSVFELSPHADILREFNLLGDPIWKRN
ncbi:MAG: AAA family ATPase [Candidatus Omnitrophica bacterium]|jgi:CO dehydrogenase maturation factor|nr:AAA family ATPase [Candidatus Omnitrophota bacterium]MDD5661071.1 AAA family ATPase [Candidatus Omnitrophota bacterium]